MSTHDCGVTLSAYACLETGAAPNPTKVVQSKSWLSTIVGMIVQWDLQRSDPMLLLTDSRGIKYVSSYIDCHECKFSLLKIKVKNKH